MKGSDEELPLSMVGRECSGGWFQFLLRANFGHYHEQFFFFKKKVSKTSSQTSRNPQHV